MAEKKRFLLRIDPLAYRALRKWAADDLRSVNAQIEFLLLESLRRAGRLPRPRGGAAGRDGGPRDESAEDAEAGAGGTADVAAPRAGRPETPDGDGEDA